MKDSRTYTLFRCCTLANYLKDYERATDLVLQGLGLKTVQIQDFGCCGYPLSNLDGRTWLVSAARSLALAEAAQACLITVCNCCYATFKHCVWKLGQDQDLRQEINTYLEKEGLKYQGQAEVRHLFQVLLQDIGKESLGQRVVNPAHNLQLVLHYGCRILRPKYILGMDNPSQPEHLDALVEAVQARSIPWSRKSDCCGAPVWATDKELSGSIARSKTSQAREAGADGICVACPFCHLRLGSIQNQDPGIQVIAYPQLLAYCLGANPEEVGLKQAVSTL